MGTDVHFWLRLALSRDRSLTVEKLLGWFYPDYFGAAADHMRYVYERLETHMRNADPAVIPPPFHAIDLSRTPGLYPVNLIEDCLAKVALAREKVRTDKLRLARVARDENCLRLILLFVKSYLASRAYYETGNAADRGRAILYADEYLDRARETHFTPSLGAASVLRSLTLDKAGPFKKRARLNKSSGNAWRAVSMSGFKPGLWGLDLPPKTDGEIVYEVNTISGLVFEQVKCYYHEFKGHTKENVSEENDTVMAISADGGDTWLTIPNPTEWPDISKYTEGTSRFMLRLRAENPTDKAVLAAVEWRIKGSTRVGVQTGR